MAKKDGTTEMDDPRAWSWTRDEALKKIRAQQDEVEARLAELSDSEGRKLNAAAARSSHWRSLALHAAGGASQSDVSKAEKIATDAEREHQKGEGEKIILQERRSALRAQAIAETARARGRAVQKYRAAYIALLKREAAIVVEGQEVAANIKRVFDLALADFPWASVEAATHGTAAGLGPHSAAPVWLLPDDGGPRTGGAAAWLTETADLAQRQGLTEGDLVEVQE